MRKLLTSVLLKKSQLLVLMTVLLLGTVTAFASTGQEFSKQSEQAASQQEAYTVYQPKTVDVYLKREFLDGETSVNVVSETIYSMEDFWALYADWELVDQNTSKVIFKKKVNDISPLLKASGYFGLSKDNILTIYNGKPEEQEAIQSFYQIDVKELESHLQEELQQGIPINSKSHYQKVIKQLKEYAVSRKS